MGAAFILGILTAFTCVAACFCLVALILLRRIGQCQAEAEAEKELFPGVLTACRMLDASAE